MTATFSGINFDRASVRAVQAVLGTDVRVWAWRANGVSSLVVTFSTDPDRTTVLSQVEKALGATLGVTWS